MSELTPYPFERLVRRLGRELAQGTGLFGLPRASFYQGDPARDTSVLVHGRLVSSPLGPAAGPHTQLAQNIVLSWLAGARVFELKTVQVMDTLQIPRPCIDMRNVGYNVEWSQELTLERSLEEYVKAAMLVDILRAEGLARGYERSLFDMSVGYDLAGVRGPRVRAFIGGMKDASAVVARLRAHIPAEAARWKEVPFTTRISDTVTLSTFHGCPPREIEDIAAFLMAEEGLSVSIKLNPTLLGPAELRGLLHERLGYKDVVVPDEAFEKDARWDDVVGIVERLEKKAAGLGVGFGVKFCNTLVVENRAGFLPATEKTSYLSGAPLHVLAMALVAKFRARFGSSIPVSFSGGIDKANFPDAVALGLAPVTVCSDLLKPGGYGRLRGCMEELGRRMDAAGTADLPAFVAQSRRADAYAAAAAANPRYARPRNAAVPRKVGTRLGLFDCLTCDKCLSACPNGANFSYEPAAGDAPPQGTLKKRRQFANFADFCNECGNCDVFCPEEGGPQNVKPRFFGSLDAWKADGRDGFYLERSDGAETMHGRIAGREYRLRVAADAVERTGGTAGEDAAPFLLMDFLRKAVLGSPTANYVNS